MATPREGTVAYLHARKSHYPSSLESGNPSFTIATLPQHQMVIDRSPPALGYSSCMSLP
jgi:hypothetical protein